MVGPTLRNSAVFNSICSQDLSSLPTSCVVSAPLLESTITGSSGDHYLNFIRLR